MVDFEICSRALKHYSKKFEMLKTDKELEQRNEFLEKDIDVNLQHIRKISESLESIKVGTTLRDNSPLIKYALKIYREDLIKIKDLLVKKIGEEWYYNLDNLNIEIASIEETLNQIK